MVAQTENDAVFRVPALPLFFFTFLSIFVLPVEDRVVFLLLLPILVPDRD